MRPTCNQVIKLAQTQVGYKAPGPGKRNKYAAYIDSHFPAFYIAGNEGGGHGQVKKHKVLKTNKSIYGYGRPRYA